MSEKIHSLSLSSVNDGFFELQYRNDGVYLIVHPPIGKGKKVEAKEVIERLNRKKVKNYKQDIVELACLKADKVPLCIAEPQEEEKIDAQINVVISQDNMKASIVITPPDGGRDVSIEDIMEALNKMVYVMV